MQLALRRDGSSGYLKERPVVYISRHRSKGAVPLLQLEQKAAAQRFFASRSERTWNAICQAKNKFHFGSALPECPFWFPSSRRLIRRA